MAYVVKIMLSWLLRLRAMLIFKSVSRSSQFVGEVDDAAFRYTSLLQALSW